MRRGAEWFDKVEFHLVLWWVEAGCIPSLEEANARLELLEKYGSTERAFSFKMHVQLNRLVKLVGSILKQ